MQFLRDTLQGAVRRLFSWELMRIGTRAYACVPSSELKEAWFNLEVQRQLLFERLAVDLVVDVGANIGQFGHLIRRTYSGELLSFEPASSAYERLAGAAARDPLWRTFRCALGQTDGELELGISPLSVFNSFLETNDYCAERFGSESRPIATERVAVRRLDAALLEAMPSVKERRVYVKLDTQGYDLKAFLGMQGILGSVVAFQSEVSLRAIYHGASDWLESLRIYQDAGFQIGGMFPVVTDGNGYPIEYDCLMVKAPVRHLQLATAETSAAVRAR